VARLDCIQADIKKASRAETWIDDSFLGLFMCDEFNRKTAQPFSLIDEKLRIETQRQNHAFQ
jgi:hypothetical protein